MFNFFLKLFNDVTYKLFFFNALNSNFFILNFITKILLFMKLKIFYNSKLNFDILNYITICERISGKKPFIKKIFLSKVIFSKRQNKKKFKFFITFNMNFVLQITFTKNKVYSFFNFFYYFIQIQINMLNLFNFKHINFKKIPIIKFFIKKNYINKHSYSYLQLTLWYFYFMFNYTNFKYPENFILKNDKITLCLMIFINNKLPKPIKDMFTNYLLNLKILKS